MAEYQKTTIVQELPTTSPNVNNNNISPPHYAETVNSGTATLAIAQSPNQQPPSFIEKIEPQHDEASNGQGAKGAIDNIAAPGMVTPLDRLGEDPAWVDCPFCQKRTQTRVTHSDSSATTIAGVLCCLICVCFACIPCIAGWCQNTEHFCSNCGKKLAFKPHDGAITVMPAQSAAQVPSRYDYGQQQPLQQLQQPQPQK